MHGNISISHWELLKQVLKLINNNGFSYLLFTGKPLPTELEIYIHDMVPREQAAMVTRLFKKK